MEDPYKSYYSIIPSEVRYSKELTANEKLLYSEITALTNSKGYCFASNGYFADLYEVHKNTVSRWISNLSKLGFINTFDHILPSGAVERRIFIGMEGINNNVYPLKQSDLPPLTKEFTPLNNIVNHNNTINTKSNNTINKEIDLIFPFDSVEFLTAWSNWIEDRKERKIKKYTNRGEQGALHNLQNISNNNEHTAIQIINQSITQGWQGLFPLKNQSNERNTNNELARLLADKYKD